MNKERLNKVKQLAARLHFGQKRSCGADYISHPIAVAEIAANKKISFVNFDKEFLLAICYLHDSIEDCGVSEDYLKTELEKFEYRPEDAELITYIVSLLTRMSKEEDIIEYLEQIKNEPYASWAKICDLEHNMSDLKPSNLLDKYKLCYNFLTQ